MLNPRLRRTATVEQATAVWQAPNGTLPPVSLPFISSPREGVVGRGVADVGHNFDLRVRPKAQAVTYSPYFCPTVEKEVTWGDDQARGGCSRDVLSRRV